MECPDEQTLLDFLAGRLGGEATTRVREHVGECEICNAVATELIAGAASHLAGPAGAKGYELAAGALVDGRYRLVGPLGEGGMGVVWEAEPTGGAERASVAIKLLKAFDPASKKRFLREVRIASTLPHPGLVRVLDVLEDVEAGCPALVMERLVGEPLSSRLLRDGRIDPPEARRIVRRLASTLSAVHAAGIVHRDVKPANVFLLADRSRPVVLLDLGLAKAKEGAGTPAARLTRTGHAVGTPAYMAPEQLGGDASIDGRADLWALGVILYESLTGRRPFAGKTIAEVLRSIRRGPPPPTEGIDPPTGTLVAALLSPAREARPRAAELVADALARVDPNG